jgi:two-component system chemotaxis response regulator CheB
VQHPLFPRGVFDLVAVAASSGGVAALQQIVGALPTAFLTPLAIVQHCSPLLPSYLAQILGAKAARLAQYPQHGERLRAGRIYVAPPGSHLILGAGACFALEDSARLNYVRPSADRLFVSAAEQLRERLLCVVLSGNGCDGAYGVRAASQYGSMVIVQDPISAESPSMPEAAILTGAADLVLPLPVIAKALQCLCEVAGAREFFCGSQAAA